MTHIFVSSTTHAAGYTDGHSNGILTSWTTAGARSWTESGGEVLPENGNKNRGFCINDYPCTDNGEFFVMLHAIEPYNNCNGGAVFRYTDTTSYYWISLFENTSSGQNPGNVIKVFSNTTDFSSGTALLTISNLNFTGLNSHYPVKVVLSGSDFTFFLNGTKIGSLNDSKHSSGKVGYAYHSQWNSYTSYDSSAWIDGTGDYTWDISTSSGIQSGTGTWGTDSFWTSSLGDGTSLVAWPGSGNSATFAGSTGYTILVNKIQDVHKLTVHTDSYVFTGGTLHFGNESVISVANSISITIGSALSSSTGISKNGGGTLVLTGSSTYTTPTTINAGTLQIGNNNTSGSLSNLSNISNNSTLVFYRSDNYDYSGFISGTGRVIKNGAGTLTLSGANSYSGETTVASGALHVAGSTASASAVTVATAAILGGTGTVNGTVKANGIIAPGTTGYGILTIGKNLIFSSTGSLFSTIGGTTAGLNYDQVVIGSGTLTLASASLSLVLSYAPGVSETYTLIDNAGTNSVSGTFNGYPQGSTITLAYGNTSYDFAISYSSGNDNNDVILTCMGSTLVDVNATKLTDLSFNSMAAAIHIGWSIDTSKYNGKLDIGIAYNLDNFPETMNNGIIIQAAAVKGDTLLQPIPLLSDTLYYVSLFVRKPGGEWGGVTDSMRGAVRTDASVIADLATITSIKFDSLSEAISIGWSIDTSKYKGKLDIGIAYSLDNFPVTMSNGIVVKTAAVNGDTMLQPNPLLSDTLYYVSLFIRKPGGEWGGATDSMRGTVYTRIFSREIANFRGTPVGDTIHVFNRQVILWEDSTSSGSIDTLEVYQFTVPEEFTVVGTPLKFVNQHVAIPLFVGIRIGTLPAGASIHDVRIYHDSAGAILVDYLSKVDVTKGIVYVKTTDTHLPFIAMIDRAKPVLECVRCDSSPVYPDTDLFDSVSISDNVSNIRWEHLYNRADSTLEIQNSGTLSRIKENLQLVIPGLSGAISSDCGVRSLLVVSDGVHSDTINLSRSVYRDKSDLFTTEQEVWQPVYSTAVLESTSPDSLVIARSAGEYPVYDQRYRRLFRWVMTDDNRGDINKWVEYDPGNAITMPYFSLVPGRMFWLKTKESTTINLGPGYTVSLRKPFSFTLPPNQFTDLGTPFRFGVQIDDILSASGSVADSVQIYTWTYNESAKRYTCEPLYIKGMAGKQDRSQLIASKKPGIYCLYNPYEQPIELKIPLISGSKKGTTTLAKKKVPFWGAKFIVSAAKGYDLPALYCGYTPGYGEGNYPVAPSFEEIQVFLYDRTVSKRQGHYIAENASQGLAKELHISNMSGSTEVISYRFETAGVFPESFSPYLFDNTTGCYSKSGAISIEPHSIVSRWLIVGDIEWRTRFVNSATNFRYEMQRIYPNPVRSAVTFRYTVGMDTEKRMCITIFDLRGRIIWEKHIDKLLAPGNHLLTWNGIDRTHTAVGAGMYLVRISVINTKGKTLQKFDQRFTFIP